MGVGRKNLGGFSPPKIPRDLLEKWLPPPQPGKRLSRYFIFGENVQNYLFISALVRYVFSRATEPTSMFQHVNISVWAITTFPQKIITLCQCWVKNEKANFFFYNYNNYIKLRFYCKRIFFSGALKCLGSDNYDLYVIPIVLMLVVVICFGISILHYWANFMEYLRNNYFDLIIFIPWSFTQ